MKILNTPPFPLTVVYTSVTTSCIHLLTATRKKSHEGFRLNSHYRYFSRVEVCIKWPHMLVSPSHFTSLRKNNHARSALTLSGNEQCVNIEYSMSPRKVIISQGGISLFSLSLADPQHQLKGSLSLPVSFSPHFTTSMLAKMLENGVSCACVAARGPSTATQGDKMPKKCGNVNSVWGGRAGGGADTYSWALLPHSQSISPLILHSCTHCRPSHAPTHRPNPSRCHLPHCSREYRAVFRYIP